MVEYFFTFRSVTTAMRAERMLQQAGVKTSLLRTPAQLRKQGCGYSIRVSEQGYLAASAILQQGEFQKVYRRKNENWEEVVK